MEIRKDWFTGRVSIISEARGRRPHYFSEVIEQKTLCPFCPGNEKMTPKAELITKIKGDKVEVETGEEVWYSSEWNSRIFNNLYPAFDTQSKNQNYPYGYHYLIVETKDHNKDINEYSEEEIKSYVVALVSIKEKIEEDKNIRYVSIFRNYGREAGASVSHAHTQIIGSYLIPPSIEREMKIFSEKREAMNLLIDEARSQERIISDEEFLVFVPFAPISPFEFWITSKDKVSDITKDKEELHELFSFVKKHIFAMKKVLGNVSYNYYFHIAPSNYNSDFHWHMEIVPRINIYAGYELGFGATIITTKPEVAASTIKQALKP